jgi:hypothetical protein
MTGDRLPSGTDEGGAGGIVAVKHAATDPAAASEVAPASGIAPASEDPSGPGA